MTTRIRVNVSGELIARAKRQAEAARFLRLEQQQLRAAGAQIAAATAQERQAPSGGRSFWQSRGRRGAGPIEEPIAFKRKEIAFIMFSLRGLWGGIEQSPPTYDPQVECRIKVTAPSRDYVSDTIDLSFISSLSPEDEVLEDQFFISSMKRSYTIKNGYAGINGEYFSISDAEKRTIKPVRDQSYKDFREFLGSDAALPDRSPSGYSSELAAIPIFASGSVSEFKIESKNLIPLYPDSKIYLAWGKLGQYTNTVVLPSSLPEVYTYTMTWLKQQ